MNSAIYVAWATALAGCNSMLLVSYNGMRIETASGTVTGTIDISRLTCVQLTYFDWA